METEKQGFTVMEIFIVILILGIIAATVSYTHLTLPTIYSV